MENNENNEDFQEETQEEESQEETQEETQEEENSQDETDWKAEALKYKAIAERKDKKLKQEPKKPNQEPNANTIEQQWVLAQGVSLDEFKIVEKFARNEGVSLAEAYKDDYVQTKINKSREEEKLKQHSLGASSGSTKAPREKTISNMTPEEHRAFAEERLKNVTFKR